tara:strand:+ start:231 stop:644 length:414 start_codon:yes stop_codon:yes gene_type:complete
MFAQQATSLFSTPSPVIQDINEVDEICNTLSSTELVINAETDISTIGMDLVRVNVVCRTNSQYSTITSSANMYAFFSRKVSEALSPICEEKGWYVANVFTNIEHRSNNTLSIELSRDTNKRYEPTGIPNMRCIEDVY